jgi:AcrR family transcriptional regulator
LFKRTVAFPAKSRQAVKAQSIHSPKQHTMSRSKPEASSPKPAAPRRGRPPAAEKGNDPDRTPLNILEVATKELADKGFAGARIDEIAALTQTSKRMIYYHFASKEGLYIAVLENEYSRIRAIESELKLDDLPPLDALRRLVEFTFDYQVGNPDFIRLVMNENIHNGEFMAQSNIIQRLNTPAISGLGRVYERGCEAAVFRKGLDPVDLHMSISALCFFTVSNRHTFSLIFKRDLKSPAALAMRRASIVDMIVRHVLA